MGNCLHILRANKRISSVCSLEDERILRIVKADGKLLEYRESVLVRDILMNFEGCRIGASIDASQHLPSSHMMTVGQIYYLLPSMDARINGCLTHRTEGEDSDQEEGGNKRIKVVLTKQQLQQLLSMKMSLEEMLSGIVRKEPEESFGSPTSWRPKLTTILEGIEHQRSSREPGSIS